MRISLPSGTLRDWSCDDRHSLAFHANHPEVSKWMRDGFPSPYTLEDADRFLTMATREHAHIFLAIDINGEAVGGIGIHMLEDIYRKTAEIGYWLSPVFQGQGIVTNAVRALIPIAFEIRDIIRIQAGVFHTNLPSMRVLEKCGFFREAIHKHAIIKNGQMFDEYLYVLFHTNKVTERISQRPER